MAEYKVVDAEKLDSDLTAIADEVRVLAGTEEKMSIEVITESVADANEKIEDQAELIEQLKTALSGKAVSGKEEQEKSLDITENGTFEILPDENKVLSKVTANVSIPQQIDALVNDTLTEYKSSDITMVRVYAFYRATALETVEIPNVTVIGMYAFYQCFVKNFKLPEKVSSIGVQAFRKSSIEITEIPASLTSLNQYVFAECRGIKELTFKGTAKRSINASAFYGCDNLETINVPWAEGEVADAPWGATNATINYNYTEGAE